MGNVAFFAAADPFTPGTPYPQGAAADVTTGQLGTVGLKAQTPVYKPSHSFFWFGAVLAATAGFIGLSVHGRFGPFKAAGDIGEKGKK